MFYPQFSSVVFQDDVSAQVHGFSQTWPWFGFLSDAMMGPRPVGHCHSWMPYEQIGELMSSLNIATKTYLKVLPYNKKTKNEYKKNMKKGKYWSSHQQGRVSTLLLQVFLLLRFCSEPNSASRSWSPPNRSLAEAIWKFLCSSGNHRCLLMGFDKLWGKPIMSNGLQVL
jgi:hypothetical protein